MQGIIILFTKGKQSFAKQPPIKDALELHISRANYQTKIWLAADKLLHMVENPAETLGWKVEDDCIKIVWTRLPPVPQACIELICCGCKTKCRSAGCMCEKKKCILACNCNSEGCCNPHSLST